MAFYQASKRSDLCGIFEGKHRMAIHFEDLFVASPVIAQEAAGRLEKVVYTENCGSYLTGRKGILFFTGRQLSASLFQLSVYKKGLTQTMRQMSLL
jgi:hypothetical protein